MRHNRKGINRASVVSLLALQRSFLVFAVVAFVVGMLPVIQLGEGYSGPTATQSSGEGNPLNQMFFASLYAVMLLLFLPAMRRVFQITVADVLVWSMTALAIASVMWSLNPALTVRRSIPLIGTVVLATILGTRLDVRQQLKLFFVGLFLALLLALAYVFAVPQVGIDPQGAWQGYFPTKNELGRLATYLSVVSLYASGWRWMGAIRIFVLLLTLFAIIKSSSATALIVWVFVVAMYAIFHTRPRKDSIATFSFVVGMLTLVVSVAGILLYFNFASAMAFLGKDPTLTGRTYLWTSSLEAGLEKPLLGYGYNGFWLGGPGSPALDIMRNAPFPGATHAHNGYLDVFLDTGGVGLLLILLMIGLTLLAAWRTWLRTADANDSWPIVFMSMIIVSNMVESIFLRHSSYPYLIFLTVVISTARRYVATKDGPTGRGLSRRVHVPPADQYPMTLGNDPVSNPPGGSRLL